MRGAWAGEIGQTQFMPSTYLKYATSADGGAVADLIGNSEDALASTANFLKPRAGSAARVSTKASPISLRCSNGTPRRSTPRRSPFSPTGWPSLEAQ